MRDDHQHQGNADHVGHQAATTPQAPTHAHQANHDDHAAHPGHGGPHDGRDAHDGHDAHDGAHGDHDRHAGHSAGMFRDRFWLSLALTVPVVLWSRDPQAWLGYRAPDLPGSALIPPILGTVVFVYGGLVFIRSARHELAARQPGMMTLISLAIAVAFVTSWAGTLGLFEVEIWMR